MTTDDILQAIHTTDPSIDPSNLDQARLILREHEAWVSLDLLASQLREIIPTHSIHFPAITTL